MVATTYMWVMDLKVTIILSIYMMEASNKDQALLTDIRKKDMINIINVILTFVMIELLDWSPVTFGFFFRPPNGLSPIRTEPNTE